MSIIKLRIQQLIKNSGKTQNSICKDLNISKQTLSNWKTGYSEPIIDDLIMLADYFNVSVDYLVGYENEDGTKNTNINNSFNNFSGNGNNIKF